MKLNAHSFLYSMHEILYKMHDILKILSSDETLYTCTLSITEYCEQLALAIELTIFLTLKLTIVHDEPELLLS
jgi:hypothetical protein